MRRDTKIKKALVSSMFAALIAVATMVIKIPTPPYGYVNLGDAFILVASWILSPGYGFFAAALGSAFADFALGYTIYIPATFLIKGIMAIAANLLYRSTKNRLGALMSKIVAGIAAEIVMVLGYFIFESLMYAVAIAATNTLLGGIQAVAGLVVGVYGAQLLEKKLIK